MSLTSNCDAIGIIPEEAFNKIISQVMYQMPSTFNYATENLIKNNRYCSTIYAHPALKQMGKDIVSEVDQIPVLGTDEGMDFCMQLKELKLDLNPTNTIVLPPEMSNLTAQQFSIKIKIKAGVDCGNKLQAIFPPRKLVTKVKKKTAKSIFDVKNLMEKKLADIFGMDRGIVFTPQLFNNLSCFDMEVYAKLMVVKEDEELSLQLLGLEIKDIEPVALENIIECYVKKVLEKTVLPKVKIEMSKLAFGLDSYLSISPMPTNQALPFNPSVVKDNLTVYLKVE